MNTENKAGDSAVKAMLLEFASTTTAHGISRFATTPVWTVKVSWFLIWLGVMAGFIFMVVQLVLLYSSKPVSTNVSVKYERVILSSLHLIIVILLKKGFGSWAKVALLACHNIEKAAEVFWRIKGESKCFP